MLPGAILRYHRVASLTSDPHDVTVTPSVFQEHLEVIRAGFAPLSLASLVTRGRSGDLPSGAVALTFDDGYDDVARAAAPLLARYDVPATVFVVTGYVDQPREFWWDRVALACLGPGRMPERIALRVGHRDLTCALGQSAVYSDQDVERHRAWTWRSPDDPTPRHRLFRELLERLKPLDEPERLVVIGELESLSGIGTAVRASHRALDSEALVALHRGGLVEVAAHSVSHPLVPRLPTAQQRHEVGGSKRFLEQLLGSPVRHFAYPFGSAGRTWRVVREVGFDAAFTTKEGAAAPGDDRYRLPRVFVGNWSGAELERRLASLVRSAR